MKHLPHRGVLWSYLHSYCNATAWVRPYYPETAVEEPHRDITLILVNVRQYACEALIFRREFSRRRRFWCVHLIPVRGNPYFLVYNIMTIDETHDSEALLSKESVDSEESWDYSAKLHRPKSRRKEVLKKVVLSILIIFPWTVIIVLGISGWNLGRERKPEWYIRPELTYSKLFP